MVIPLSGRTALTFGALPFFAGFPVIFFIYSVAASFDAAASSVVSVSGSTVATSVTASFVGAAAITSSDAVDC
jgi:hypothetical protein